MVEEYLFVDYVCAECGATLTVHDHIPLYGSCFCQACLAAMADEDKDLDRGADVDPYENPDADWYEINKSFDMQDEEY